METIENQQIAVDYNESHKSERDSRDHPAISTVRLAGWIGYHGWRRNRRFVHDNAAVQTSGDVGRSRASQGNTIRHGNAEPVCDQAIIVRVEVELPTGDVHIRVRVTVHRSFRNTVHDEPRQGQIRVVYGPHAHLKIGDDDAVGSRLQRATVVECDAV